MRNFEATACSNLGTSSPSFGEFIGDTEELNPRPGTISISIQSATEYLVIFTSIKLINFRVVTSRISFFAKLPRTVNISEGQGSYEASPINSNTTQICDQPVINTITVQLIAKQDVVGLFNKGDIFVVDIGKSGDNYIASVQMIRSKSGTATN